MAKESKRMAKESKRTAKSLRALEVRLDDLHREHRRLTKRVEKLTKRSTRAGAPLPGSPGPGRGWRGPGRPPWAKGAGPVVSIEVPLETGDPTAPLWATVAARLPEEISTVTDDGQVVHYRYSAVGSTPQAPRYRPLAAPGPGSPEPFPG